MELDSQERAQERSRAGRWSWTLKREPRRDQEQGGGAGLSRGSPGEIKSRDVELGFHNRMVCLAAKLFLNSCFSDTVFVTLLRTAVETAVSGVHELLRTGGVPTSLKLLFWRWLTISSVFTGRSTRMSYSSLLPPPPPPRPPPPAPVPPPLFHVSNNPYGFWVSVDVQHHDS